jgi:uncharacterized membrane protein
LTPAAALRLDRRFDLVREETIMAQAHILVGGTPARAEPAIRRIGLADLKDALAKGWTDFAAMPSHAVFLCIIYPVIGMVLAGLTLGFSVLPLLYPLATGFALIGPFAALGLYELSRRREMGGRVSVTDVGEVMNARSIDAIIALGILLLAIFLIWIATAKAIYIAHFGYAAPESIEQFVNDVLFTSTGWSLILIGNGVGFLFAALVLTISVVSFPLLVDRDVGAVGALLTSVRAVFANPVTMALWGLIVAALLFLGSLPLFLGLPVVLPILGHATWHLYRKVIEPAPKSRSGQPRRRERQRYAADFPAVLFPGAGETRAAVNPRRPGR